MAGVASRLWNNLNADVTIRNQCVLQHRQAERGSTLGWQPAVQPHATAIMRTLG
jgi:hypothetical protein